jgi:hypothetical protein
MTGGLSVGDVCCSFLGALLRSYPAHLLSTARSTLSLASIEVRILLIKGVSVATVRLVCVPVVRATSCYSVRCIIRFVSQI